VNDVQRFPLRDIIRDPKCQPRVKPLDNDHVEDLRTAKANGAKFPPVVIYREQFSLGKYNLYLSEGFHRFEVYDLDAEEYIEAEVRDGTLDDAIVNAMASNCNHGLKRTSGDLKKAIVTLIEMKSDWSDRRIADHVHASHSYVSQIHRDLTPDDDRPEPKVKVCSDGVERNVVKPKPSPAKVKPKVEPNPAPVKPSLPPVERATTVEAAAMKAEATLGDGFDWPSWNKHFGGLVRLVGEAAKQAGIHNGDEHRAAMNAADAIRKFCVAALSKPRGN